MAQTAKPAGRASARCLCGTVRLEIDVPARWAFHDHLSRAAARMGRPTRPMSAAGASDSGCVEGESAITRYEDKASGTLRSFCARCGTPLFYERARSPHMVNIPRALFSGRTGRQPLYHLAIEELQEWAYAGEPLVPLKGFPGVVWQRSKKKKRPRPRGHVLA